MKISMKNQTEKKRTERIADESGKQWKKSFRWHQWAAVLLVVCFFLLPGFTYQKDKQRIYDNAGLFTEDEINELEEVYQDYSLEDKMDYILLTTNSTDGMESREYARQFYVEQGFGYNKENGDGNLLLIDMDNRRIEMIDKGICVDYIRDEEVDAILDEVAEELSDEDYEEAARVYAEETHSAFVTDAASSGKNNLIRYLIYGVLALVFAGIVTGVLVSGNKSHMSADCHTYTKDIRVNPHTRQDRYLRTITTSTPKPKHDSDGGGGSHDSSGFGGGGRSF